MHLSQTDTQELFHFIFKKQSFNFHEDPVSWWFLCYKYTLSYLLSLLWIMNNKKAQPKQVIKGKLHRHQVSHLLFRKGKVTPSHTGMINWLYSWGKEEENQVWVWSRIEFLKTYLAYFFQSSFAVLIFWWVFGGFLTNSLKERMSLFRDLNTSDCYI